MPSLIQEERWRRAPPIIVTHFHAIVPANEAQGGSEEAQDSHAGQGIPFASGLAVGHPRRGSAGSTANTCATPTSWECHEIVSSIADRGSNIIQTSSTGATTWTQSRQRSSFPCVAFPSERLALGRARVMKHVNSLSHGLIRGSDVGSLPDTDEEKLQWIGLTETAVIMIGAYLVIGVALHPTLAALITAEHGNPSEEFWSDKCWRAYFFRSIVPSCLSIAFLFSSLLLLSKCKRFGISYSAAFTGMVISNMAILYVQALTGSSIYEPLIGSIWALESLVSITPFFLLPAKSSSLVISTCLFILFVLTLIFEIARFPLKINEIIEHQAAHNVSESKDFAFDGFPCTGSHSPAKHLAISVFTMIFAGLLCSIGVLAALRRFQRQHHELELRTEAHMQKSEEMSLRNNELLCGLFPPVKAAEVLSLDRSTLLWCESSMDVHQDVSVLQVDIKGFTALSTRIDAAELLDIVNAIFSSIDAAAEIIGGLFKIETVGDCYKAVSGMLVPRKDHADKVAELALAIIDIVKIISRRLRIPDLSVRVGIGTGPVVAAVVGQLCPRFCIYGRACQDANLLEASAQEGRLHVSRETLARLGEHWKVEDDAAKVNDDGAYVCPIRDASIDGAWNSRLEKLLTSLQGFNMPPTPAPAIAMPGLIQLWAQMAASEARTPKQPAPSLDLEVPQPGRVYCDCAPCESSDSSSSSSISIIMLSASGVSALATTLILPVSGLTAFTFTDGAPGVVYAVLATLLIVLHILPTLVGPWRRRLKLVTTILLFLSPFAFNPHAHTSISHLSSAANWAFMGVLNHQQSSSRSKAIYVLFSCSAVLIHACEYLAHHHPQSMGFNDEDIWAEESIRRHTADNDPADDDHFRETLAIGIYYKIIIGVRVLGIAVIFFSTVAYRLSHVIRQEAQQRSALAVQIGLEETQDDLLRTLVLQRVCHQLKRGDRFISSRHDQATVMFVYLDQFDEILSKHGPEETIGWVRNVFCEMDSVVSGQSPLATCVTKIESFPSFFMAVCGLEGEADNMDVAVKMAINLAEVGVAVKRPDGTLTSLKIGMDCGPLSAGVIGVRFPRFSVFGETVNMASRWASNADVTTFFRTVVGLSENAVHHISGDMMNKLAACNLEVRDIGLKDIKGKGCECMWEISSRTERDHLLRSFHSSLLKLPCVQQTGRRLSQSLGESPLHAGVAVKFDSSIGSIWLEPLHGYVDASPSLETGVSLQQTLGGAETNDQNQTPKRHFVSPQSPGRPPLIPLMRLRAKSSRKSGRRQSID